MPTYVSLIKWTDQGRANAATLADRVDDVEKKLADMGIQQIGHWMTMGRYDQIAVFDAPSDEAVGKAILLIAGRGNVSTETLRAWTMDEVRRFS